MRCFNVNREMCFHRGARYGRRLMRKKTKRMPPAATAYAWMISISGLCGKERISSVGVPVNKVNRERMEKRITTLRKNGELCADLWITTVRREGCYWEILLCSIELRKRGGTGGTGKISHIWLPLRRETRNGLKGSQNSPHDPTTLR